MFLVSPLSFLASFCGAYFPLPRTSGRAWQLCPPAQVAWVPRRGRSVPNQGLSGEGALGPLPPALEGGWKAARSGTQGFQAVLRDLEDGARGQWLARLCHHPGLGVPIPCISQCPALLQAPLQLKQLHGEPPAATGGQCSPRNERERRRGKPANPPTAAHRLPGLLTSSRAEPSPAEPFYLTPSNPAPAWESVIKWVQHRRAPWAQQVAPGAQGTDGSYRGGSGQGGRAGSA